MKERKKMMKRIAVIFMTIMVSLFGNPIVPVWAQTTDIQAFQEVDASFGVYRWNGQQNEMLKKCDQGQSDNILYDSASDTYYLKLEQNLYARAVKYDFVKDTFQNSEEFTFLKNETQQRIIQLFQEAEQSGTPILNDTITVYIPEQEAALEQDNADYPVRNEFIEYERGSIEGVAIAADHVKFSSYRSKLLQNCAMQFIGSVISKLNPFAGAIKTFLELLPDNYETVSTCQEWSLSAVVNEKKTEQLSWVTVAGNVFLGAHTESAAIKINTTFQDVKKAKFYNDTTPFIYYRTPNYQSPEKVARQHYNDTYVEGIDYYMIYGKKIVLR